MTNVAKGMAREYRMRLRRGRMDGGMMDGGIYNDEGTEGTEISVAI